MNDIEIMRNNLKKIPNSFLLRECLSTKSKEWVKSTINKSLNEVVHSVYELPDEYVRSYNLISFLYWSLGETAHAKEYNNKVLEMEHDNVIAIANLIEFSIEEEDAYAIQNWNEKLLDIQKSSFLLLKGEAEIAYCYTRLGLKYYETAVKSFTDILEKSNSEPINKNLIMLWKYGIGLTLRRMSHLVSVHSEAQASIRKKRMKDAINVFVNLVKEEKENNRIKAMAYTQLGELRFAVDKERLMRTEYFPQPFCSWKEENFYRTGYQMCVGEIYVLERYGKFLRYMRKYNDSEMMLRKSISIRETSFAHHHLALTLKSKLHRELTDRRKSYHYGADISPEKTPVSYMKTNSEPHKRNLFPKNNPAFNAPDVLQTYPKVGNNTVNDTSQKSLSKFTFNKVQESINFKESYTRPYTNTNSDQYMGHYQNPRSTNVNKTGSRQHLAITEKFGNNIRYSQKESSNENITHNEAQVASYSQQRFNFDSGFDSMSSSFQSLSLGASNDDTEKQARPIDSKAGVTLKQNATSFRKSKDVGTPALQSNLSSSQKSDRYKGNKTKAMIKSPKKLLSLPKDQKTAEIFYHLDQALLISENSAALYEKGLTLRAIGSLDEAIEIFKKLFSKETSLLYLANAYEQCGLCYMEKIDCLNGDENSKQRLVFNMKDYFMKSVALSAKLVSEIPNIAEIWSSASSLKEIISKENPSKQNIRELAVLSERLYNYSDAITYYKQLLKLEENVESAPQMLANIARNHMLDQDFINAATVFNMIRSHPNGDDFIDQNMYLKCLMEAGLHAVMTNVEKQLGRTYLRTALRHNDKKDPTELRQSEAEDEIEDELTFDIFILCNENDMTVYRMAAKVMSFLKRECDLSVTLNSADVMMGSPKLSETLGMIDNSETFIVFIGKTETTDNQYGLCVEHIITDKKKIVVIAEEKEIKAPAIIERFKHRINTLIYDNSVNEQSVSVDWVKKLFQQLLHVH